jgi:hypothetical protein
LERLRTALEEHSKAESGEVGRTRAAIMGKRISQQKVSRENTASAWVLTMFSGTNTLRYKQSSLTPGGMGVRAPGCQQLALEGQTV